uniref:probable ubiquitin-like-specific protease 2B isoform X2 n=1 Tax=Erigeron canadensis TaxID=72917 RepID=UPI001CB9323D|nr:probable ubiquitin-like-specific protease 2B isoform X2 [Erigeron canadensis]
MESNGITFTEQEIHPDSEKQAMLDSVDVVSNVQELPDSHAEPRAGSSGLDVNALPESEDEAGNVSPLEHKRLDQRSLSTCCVIAEDDENLEVKTMPDAVDAVHDIQDLSYSHTEARANFSGLYVNVPPGSEAPVATTSDLPNNKLKLSEVDEAHHLVPHEHKRLDQRSLSTLSTLSDIAVDDGVFCEPSPDHFPGEMGTDNEDLAPVVFYPDHMVYHHSYSTDCVLTFTSNCIEIEGSTLDGDGKTFKLQWGVQDIHQIRSHYYEMVNVAIVTFHVLIDDKEQDNNVEHTSGIELKFAVIGTNWYGSQEAITSLNAAYKTLWSNMLESEVHGSTQASLTKYFPNFDQPFEEVIYPKGDVDAVSMGKRDVDMLLPDTFVNDTIIDFYIKYLKNKLKPEDRHRFHFFNSFFFRKLVDPDKDPLDASQGKAAFLRVRKWTRKVNIFEKDYVFIPINYNYHWSLIVMCHLGEVATYKDEDVIKLTKVPCILHMDSIRGTHSGLKGIMQSYLKEEWKGRLQEAPEDISSKFDNLRFISLELPQQPNSFDCGLFLLHYVELFLEQAPIYFNPFKITKSVNFLNMDWFLPADASLKRVVIQRLVYDLLEHTSHESSSICANDECDIHKENIVNFFPDMCNNLSTACQTSQDDQGIEISTLPSLSLSSDPCPVDPRESLKSAFEPGSFLGLQFPSFNERMFDGYKSSDTPPIEEDVETGGQLVYSSIEIDLQQDNEIIAEIPCSSQKFNRTESGHQNNFETSPQTSISGCEDSFQVINGSNLIGEELDFKELRNCPISPSMEPVEMLYGNDNSKRQANEPTVSGESSGLESDVQHPSKRMRMTDPPLVGASASD